MADNEDADIDEIVGQEDLELDEIANEQPEAKEEEVKDADGNAGDDSKSDDAAEEVKDPEKPEAKDEDDSEGSEPPVSDEEKPEEKPAILTKEDLQTAISDIRDQERSSAKEIDELTEEVLSKYYPEGLSNVLVDEKTGKELRTPQDVVDASGGEMSLEEAWKWLTNEQHKLDTTINDVKKEARKVAETNANFNIGVERVISKYKPVFDAFKDQKIQERVYKAYMKQVKIDEGKELVLSAPDIEDFYDLVMEPYLLAYGNMQTQQASQGQPAPVQSTDPAPQIPDAKPSIEDRLDESGDGVSGGGDAGADPNNPDESLNKLFGE